jgi:hypothetical protein
MSERLYVRRYGAVGLTLYALTALLVIAGLAAIPGSKILDSVALAWASVAAIFGAPLVYAVARRSRQKIFPNFEAVERYVSQRGEPLFVFLREFNSDKETDSSDQDPLTGFYVTAEEKIANHFRGYGAMVAIGRPGERLPAGGSFRIYVDDNHWRSVVGNLIDRADLVLLRCGDTPGVSWELEQMVARHKLDQLVLISSKDSKKNLATYERLSAYLAPPSVANPLEAVLAPHAMDTQIGHTQRQLRETLQQFPEGDSTRAGLQRMVDEFEQGRISNERFRLEARVSGAMLYRVEDGRLEPIPGTLMAALHALARLRGLRARGSRRLKEGAGLLLMLAVPVLTLTILGCHVGGDVCDAAGPYIMYVLFAVVLTLVVAGAFAIS